MKPPKYFDNTERSIWRELIAAAPVPVSAADVPALELLVALIRKQRDRLEMSANERSSLIKLLESFGRSPLARKKMTIPDAALDKNPFDDL